MNKTRETNEEMLSKPKFGQYLKFGEESISNIRIGRGWVCYFKEPVKEGRRQRGRRNENGGGTPHAGGVSWLDQSAKDFGRMFKESHVNLRIGTERR